jgi:hypothetical protein
MDRPGPCVPEGAGAASQAGDSGCDSGTCPKRKYGKLHLSRVHDSANPTIDNHSLSFFSTLLLRPLTFGILASKRRGRDRSKSRTRSKSRSRSKHPKKGPIFVRFVIPLAGILSVVTARLYDMGGQTSASQAHEDAERAPLLGGSQRNEPIEHEAPAKRAGKWVVQNAVFIFMSLLILAVAIVFCIFFGSEFHCPSVR